MISGDNQALFNQIHMFSRKEVTDGITDRPTNGQKEMLGRIEKFIYKMPLFSLIFITLWRETNAVYMTASTMCCWAGEVLSLAKYGQNVPRDESTDRVTYEIACTRLKSINYLNPFGGFFSFREKARMLAWTIKTVIRGAAGRRK